MSEPYSYYPEEPEVLELHSSPAGVYTFFELPPSRLAAAEKIVTGLKERAYMVRLLLGDIRPEGMTTPYGIWPHPDAEAVEMIGREAEMPVYTSKELAELGRTALTAA